MTDSVYWIWLQHLFGFGSRRAELMMAYFTHPREIYGGIAAGARAAGMLTSEELSACEAAMERAREVERRTLRKGCAIITPDHPDYPPLLRSVYDRPAVLYAAGDLSCLRDTLAIAMVGTRKYTDYGRQAAQLLAGDLARSGAVVVSGLALGIDSESHRAALAAGGKTIGVLGCGIDVDYPRKNRELKTAMRGHGAVITEYPLGYPGVPENFPVRNRIISGMSHGTLVVEADLRSGSLITARLAREQGRDVFAVPGAIFQQGGQGANQLIKEGAYPVDTARDILLRYPWFTPRLPDGRPRIVEAASAPTPDDSPEARVKPAQPLPPPQPRQLPEGVTECAAQVYAAFSMDIITAEHSGATLTVDDLVTAASMPAGEILSALTELEIYGCIQSYPGRRFGLI